MPNEHERLENRQQPGQQLAQAYIGQRATWTTSYA